MKKLTTTETEWQAEEAKVTLNICLEACFVPTADNGMRLSYGHIVVLDNFFSEEMRKEIFEWLNTPGWSETSEPVRDKWERATCDQAGLPPSWGLRDEYLKDLLEQPSEAMIEIHSRLCKLYPEFEIYHMPSEIMQTDLSSQSKVDCDKFVANAAVYGDCFQWHVDSDPWTIDESTPWAKTYGVYFNGEEGRPLLVSMLIYLNSTWEREWDAETLFLDSPTESGIFIRPKLGRAVLMDQDVLHRLSTPSQLAKRPRFSLVWKLMFKPKKESQRMELARPEWGEPSFFGSAAKVRSVQRALF